jgi:hypothetical protein
VGCDDNHKCKQDPGNNEESSEKHWQLLSDKSLQVENRLHGSPLARETQLEA